jgi:hypothetical protein
MGSSPPPPPPPKTWAQISTKTKTLEKTLSRCETKWKPTWWFPLVSPLVTGEEQPTNWVATQKTRNSVAHKSQQTEGTKLPN